MEIGQYVFVGSLDFTRRVYEGEITKSGRKYVYARENTYNKELQFEKDTLETPYSRKNKYNRWKLYSCEQDWIEEGKSVAITESQMNCIKIIEEMLGFKFEGTGKSEASVFISKHIYDADRRRKLLDMKSS